MLHPDSVCKVLEQQVSIAFPLCSVDVSFSSFFSAQSDRNGFLTRLLFSKTRALYLKSPGLLIHHTIKSL